MAQLRPETRTPNQAVSSTSAAEPIPAPRKRKETTPSFLVRAPRTRTTRGATPVHPEISPTCHRNPGRASPQAASCTRPNGESSRRGAAYQVGASDGWVAEGCVGFGRGRCLGFGWAGVGVMDGCGFVGLDWLVITARETDGRLLRDTVARPARSAAAVVPRSPAQSIIPV